MEIYNKQDKGYIEVWLTNKEQKLYDLNKLTAKILHDIENKKCKVVFYLSGQNDLLRNTEALLLTNLHRQQGSNL